MSKQKGEIATTLTLIALALMLAGTFVGTQSSTLFQRISRAADTISVQCTSQSGPGGCKARITNFKALPTTSSFNHFQYVFSGNFCYEGTVPSAGANYLIEIKVGSNTLGRSSGTISNPSQVRCGGQGIRFSSTVSQYPGSCPDIIIVAGIADRVGGVLNTPADRQSTYSISGANICAVPSPTPSSPAPTRPPLTGQTCGKTCTLGSSSSFFLSGTSECGELQCLPLPCPPGQTCPQSTRGACLNPACTASGSYNAQTCACNSPSSLTPIAAPTGVRTPLTGSCSYRAVVSVFKEKEGDLFTSREMAGSLISWGVSNSKQSQIAAAKPFGLTSSSTFEETSLALLPTPGALFSKKDKSFVKLFGPSEEDWVVDSIFCRSFGTNAGCPANLASQPKDFSIDDFTVDCGTDIEYGWILKPKTPSVSACTYTSRVKLVDENDNVIDKTKLGTLSGWSIKNSKGQKVSFNQVNFTGQGAEFVIQEDNLKFACTPLEAAIPGNRCDPRAAYRKGEQTYLMLEGPGNYQLVEASIPRCSVKSRPSEFKCVDNGTSAPPPVSRGSFHTVAQNIPIDCNMDIETKWFIQPAASGRINFKVQLSAGGDLTKNIPFDPVELGGADQTGKLGGTLTLRQVNGSFEKTFPLEVKNNTIDQIIDNIPVGKYEVSSTLPQGMVKTKIDEWDQTKCEQKEGQARTCKWKEDYGFKLDPQLQLTADTVDVQQNATTNVRAIYNTASHITYQRDRQSCEGCGGGTLGQIKNPQWPDGRTVCAPTTKGDKDPSQYKCVSGQSSGSCREGEISYIGGCGQNYALGTNQTQCNGKEKVRFKCVREPSGETHWLIDDSKGAGPRQVCDEVVACTSQCGENQCFQDGKCQNLETYGECCSDGRTRETKRIRHSDGTCGYNIGSCKGSTIPSCPVAPGNSVIGQMETRFKKDGKYLIQYVHVNMKDSTGQIVKRQTLPFTDPGKKTYSLPLCSSGGCQVSVEAVMIRRQGPAVFDSIHNLVKSAFAQESEEATVKITNCPGLRDGQNCNISAPGTVDGVACTPEEDCEEAPRAPQPQPPLPDPGDGRPIGNGYCAVEELMKYASGSDEEKRIKARNASCICQAESGSNPNSLSGLSCLRNQSREHSIGLFQISMYFASRCPGGANGLQTNGRSCTIVDQGAFDRCVASLTDPGGNIQKMIEASNGMVHWCNGVGGSGYCNLWSTATNRPGLCYLEGT